MPSPAAKLGATPSTLCRDLRHRDCPGWGKHGIFRRTVADCTCSCHVRPATPPRGGSGGSDASRYFGGGRIAPGGIIPGGTGHRLIEDGDFRGQQPSHAWLDEASDFRGQKLFGGRGYGKEAARQKFRDAYLGQMQMDGSDGFVAEYLNSSINGLLRAEATSIERAAGEAFASGCGLAVIYGDPGEVETTADGAMRIRSTVRHVALARIPHGCVYYFPTQAAYRAWFGESRG